MARRRRLKLHPDHRLAFLGEFLERPLQVGSIIPSSRFLERRIARCAGIAGARVVVELGPGTGGTTRALLDAMAPDARLLSIELNPRFVGLLRRIRDPRLHVHHGSAAEITEILAAHDLPAPDAVLSGIPFSTMPRATGASIVRAVHDALVPGGVFVAYQVRDRVGALGIEVFGRPQVQTELLNVPPMRVFRWQKPERAVGA